MGPTSKGREGKGREGKGREGKGREGKERGGREGEERKKGSPTFLFKFTPLDTLINFSLRLSLYSVPAGSVGDRRIHVIALSHQPSVWISCVTCIGFDADKLMHTDGFFTERRLVALRPYTTQ